MRGKAMNEERERIRCHNCELVQWDDRETCRRCGVSLPHPIVKIVERVVERVVVRHDPECLATLEQARELIATASERLAGQAIDQVSPINLAQVSEEGSFPTLAEVERALIVAAYKRSDRRALQAAKLLGMGKTTFYRKLKDLGKFAA
ncbi:hypothetical protein DYQ86_05130 [Acidobacteria bacterium AB60]|nr:hypothetical protein DYQ86_05130 [Acidobacteria bacterium AB60]